MAEEKNESSRDLLDQIEGDWDAPRAGSPTERRMHAELDAAADRLMESLEPPPLDGPAMAELDSGWGDDDEDEEEEDEPEPELPDERLDPVAYAAAKKARDERIEAKRARRRAKAETKKARRKARSDAQKQKQKGKTKKGRSPQKSAQPPKAERRAAAAAKRARASDDEDEAPSSDDAQEDEAPSRARAKLPPSRPMKSPAMMSKTSMWMLAVAVVVFLAAAIFAAVVAR